MVMQLTQLYETNWQHQYLLIFQLLEQNREIN